MKHISNVKLALYLMDVADYLLESAKEHNDMPKESEFQMKVSGDLEAIRDMMDHCINRATDSGILPGHFPLFTSEQREAVAMLHTTLNRINFFPLT